MLVLMQRKRKQEEVNKQLESLRGRSEKQYWNMLKKLMGSSKKEENLPEEIQLGNKVGRGEGCKAIWNEAFSKLGNLIWRTKISKNFFTWIARIRWRGGRVRVMM